MTVRLFRGALSSSEYTR